jgi:hypothetical protein
LLARHFHTHLHRGRSEAAGGSGVSAADAAFADAFDRVLASLEELAARRVRKRRGRASRGRPRRRAVSRPARSCATTTTRGSAGTSILQRPSGRDHVPAGDARLVLRRLAGEPSDLGRSDSGRCCRRDLSPCLRFGSTVATVGGGDFSESVGRTGEATRRPGVGGAFGAEGSTPLRMVPRSPRRVDERGRSGRTWRSAACRCAPLFTRSARGRSGWAGRSSSRPSDSRTEG